MMNNDTKVCGDDAMEMKRKKATVALLGAIVSLAMVLVVLYIGM